MNDFAKTRMGHQFFVATLPELVRQLTIIAAQLGRIATELERRSGVEKPEPATAEPGSDQPA